MISWENIYKVVISMAPLYVPLGLGYASVKRWRMFNPDQCDAINRFNCYFIIPFFTFHFTAGVNPYHMNFRFLAGDVVAKAVAGVSLALWANFWKTGNFSWAITSFSLWSLNNTLVVGVPLLRAMYGPVGEDLVVQSSVIQALLWFPTLLFMLELRRSILEHSNRNSIDNIEIVVRNENDHQVENKNSTTSGADSTTAESTIVYSSPYNSVGSIMMKVGAKLARNPNCYACTLGLIWALISKRWDFEMPSILEGSVMIMAKAGSGVAMFSMGLFMALQKKVIACGVRLSLFGMILRFVGGPITMAIGAFALGLKSNTFRIAIIQAALPEAVTAFVFAQEYGLHAEVLSTAVIFGTIVSLPLLIGYYTVLDVLQV
ncbi:hypothetical protein CASFOL_003593 [Castilleja foliolosa]|uniref:Auxin efflux carrier component n=1 Tax=Castilleja foliolosa TaxID=1961234 RepID=A0ABD3EHL5_9LAMI